VHELNVSTERRTQLIDITDQVRGALDGSNGASAALVYVPHTTAGVTINEYIDPQLTTDFEEALQKIVDCESRAVPLRQTFDFDH